MRLLWLTPEVPELAGSGGAIRSFEQIAGLACRGVGVTVVAPAQPARRQSAAAALQAAGVDVRFAPRPANRLAHLPRAVAKRPSLLPRLATDAWLVWQMETFRPLMRPAVDSALREREFDAVIVEHDIAMGWADHVEELPAGIVFHNAGWLYWRRRADQGGFVTRLWSGVQARRTERHVARRRPRYSIGWPVSGEELADISDVTGDLRLDVVPNGVDVQALAGVSGDGDGDTILFSGTLSYRPNGDAALWFAQSILPLVRARRPLARFVVVGAGAPPALRKLDGVTLELTGRVPSMAPELARAAVVVAPLRWGGGTKLKVPEALAAGRPLVATGVALEGIDVEPGTHLLRADSEREFADAVVELLEDRGLAHRLAAAGRERVASRYDWDVLADVMKSSLDRWLSDRSTSP